MAHQPQPQPVANLEQGSGVPARGQAGLDAKTAGQAGRHSKLGRLHSPFQGAAQQRGTAELQPHQLRRHGGRALDSLGGESPLRIRMIGMALRSDAVAPEQQFAISQNPRWL